MRDFDVAVVGASIAGLQTARLLSRAGCRVIVLERSTSLPGDRTLIVTSVVERHLAGIPRAYVRNRVTAFELRSGDAAARVGLTSPDLVIDRRPLVGALRDDALAHGCELRSAARVTRVAPRDGGWAVEGEHRSSRRPFHVGARTLVGADGASSVVAARLSHPRPRVGSLIQGLVTTPADLPSDTARVWFDRRASRFFVWLIPEGDGRCAVGLIAEDAASARGALEGFLGRFSMKTEEYQSARVPLYDGWIPFSTHVSGSAAYFVGDSAAHVKVTTVGGVVHGLDAAHAAADQILGKSRRRERRLRAELEMHRLIRAGLDRLTSDETADLVRTVGERRGRGHAASSRDTSALLLARVILHRPGVMRLGAKALLRLLSASDGPPKPPL